MERMDDASTPVPSVKIEKPKEHQKLGAFYLVLLFLSFCFILLTQFVLILEGTGTSLPTFLRFPVA